MARSVQRPQVRIGVLTLALGDETDLLHGTVYVQLNELLNQGTFDFTKSGRPYATAPDDWVPFGDSRSILDLLKDGLSDFDLFSDSANLTNIDARLGVHLFIIDPIVLVHRTKAQLAELVQEHIVSRKDKAVCVVLPQSLPIALRSELFALYAEKLKFLETNVDAALTELEADKPERLSRFLRRITPYLKGLPNPARLEEARRTLASIDAIPIQFAAPTLGAAP